MVTNAFVVMLRTTGMVVMMDDGGKDRAASMIGIIAVKNGDDNDDGN